MLHIHLPKTTFYPNLCASLIRNIIYFCIIIICLGHLVYIERVLSVFHIRKVLEIYFKGFQCQALWQCAASADVCYMWLERNTRISTMPPLP